MTEYIERRAAHGAVVDAIWHGKRSMYSVANAINSVPTADVAPVRHGRWVKIYENGEPAIEQHQVGVFCSRCKKMPKDRFSESDFCPSCGARMDGGYD